jgi:hypothetical protein
MPWAGSSLYRAMTLLPSHRGSPHTLRLGCHHSHSPNVGEEEFCELRLDGVLRSSFTSCAGFLGALTYFVPWSIYTPLTQVYAAFVTWPSE